MNSETQPNDDWWHERPTRPAGFDSAHHAPIQLARARPSVWKNAALVVGVFLAQVLSLAALTWR